MPVSHPNVCRAYDIDQGIVHRQQNCLPGDLGQDWHGQCAKHLLSDKRPCFRAAAPLQMRHTAAIEVSAPSRGDSREPNPEASSPLSVGRRVRLGDSAIAFDHLAGADEATVVAAVDRELSRLARTDQFSGVVLVGRPGKAVFHGAYGMTDREADRATQRTRASTSARSPGC